MIKRALTHIDKSLFDCFIVAMLLVSLLMLALDTPLGFPQTHY